MDNRIKMEEQMKPETKEYYVDIGGKQIKFETGKLAGQAGGSVVIQIEDAQVFGVATMSDKPREGIDFFPLSVDFEERMYAGGRIPGSFFRREGRPTEEAILTARLTDRPLRPLFPKDMRNDVQVILYAFSADGENPLDILAINAASAALMLSDIPWDGPVGAVRIGRIDGEYKINPTFKDLEISDLDLRVAGTKDAVLMVEAGAKEVSEDVMLRALEIAHENIIPLIEAQEKMAADLGKQKRIYESIRIEDGIIEKARAIAVPKLNAVYDKGLNKIDLKDEINKIKENIKSQLSLEGMDVEDKDINKAFDEIYREIVRTHILSQGLRPDGRKLDEIRDIWCEIGVSPKAHGSGLFTRGETQVLTLATLGTSRDAQSIDNLTPTEAKHYIHHYNFPPFSTGEVKPLRGASRREIGHGALAERALSPMIPSEEEFPYTIRLVSEVLSSNGSSSMASVCGSTLALMDTGVPIKAPVSGVAMGLVKEDDSYAILTDIQGLEDHLGDMDFKVAGTDKGITALQMDIKIKGISSEIMKEALIQAKIARKTIMDKMLAVIPAPRNELKPHVPRIITVRIPVDKIGAVIGPGGKIIRGLQDETGATIDIAEDGIVYIATTDEESARQVKNRIEALTETPELGRIYTGKVVGIRDFGAFVQILPGTDGMVHISQLDNHRVNRVEDIVKMGDEITVMVTGIENDGKIRLSRLAVLEGWSAEEAIAKNRNKRSGSRRPSGNRSGHSSNKNRGNRNR